MVVLPGSGRASPSIPTLNVSSVRAHRLLPSSAGVIRSRPLRMATTALNPALNIPSRGSGRFAAAPNAVGGPTPMSGRRAGHSSTAPEDAPGPRAGTRAPPRRSTGTRCPGCGGAAALRLAGHKGRRERRGSQPGRGVVTSRHSRGGDETRSRSAGLAILAMGALARFAAMKTAPGTVNLCRRCDCSGSSCAKPASSSPVWTARSRIAARTRPA